MTDTGTTAPLMCEMCGEVIPRWIDSYRLIDPGQVKIVCWKCFVRDERGQFIPAEPTPEEWAQSQAGTTTGPRRMQACPKAQLPLCVDCRHGTEHNENDSCHAGFCKTIGMTLDDCIPVEPSLSRAQELYREADIQGIQELVDRVAELTKLVEISYEQGLVKGAWCFRNSVLPLGDRIIVDAWLDSDAHKSLIKLVEG